jgi:hypothetical protein
MIMKIRKYIYFVASSMILGLAIGSCSNFVSPPRVWNSDQPYGTGGTISAVLPSNSGVSGLPSNTAIAGVREITIIGRNFSKTIDSNWVWYDVDSAAVKSYSLGGAADTIVIYRPANFGSNLYLKLVIPAADSIATYQYNIEQPVISSDLSSFISGSYVVTSGKGNSVGDTVWIAATGYLYEMIPGVTVPVMFKDTSYLKPKMIVNGKSTATDFAKPFMDMKVGPGGVLYATFNNPQTDTSIYRIDPNSAFPQVYATLSKKSVGYFDFNDNGNAYTGNANGLFLVKPDGTSGSVGDYGSFTFVGLRVIKDAGGNKFVYAASSSGLFRSPINSDGTVGAREQVYAIASDTSRLVAGGAISSFDVAADGTLFIALSGTSTYSLFTLENGSLVPYYHDGSILPTGITQIGWGSGRWLYLNSGATTLYRMGVATNSGAPILCAPYLGRGL